MQSSVRRSLTEFLFVVFLLAGLPLFMIREAWTHIQRQHYASNISARFESLDRNLFRLQRDSNDLSFMSQKLNTLYGFLSESALTPEIISSAVKLLQIPDFHIMRLYFFDRHGEIVGFNQTPMEFRPVVKRIFSALAEPEASGENKLMTQYRPFFQSFLGEIEPGDLMKEKSSLTRVHLNGKPGFFYWNTFYSIPDLPSSGKYMPDGSWHPQTMQDTAYSGGMIAIVEEENIPPGSALKTMIQELNATAEYHEFYGVIDLSSGSGSSPIADNIMQCGITRASLKKRIVSMQSHFSKHAVSKRYLTSILPIDGNQVVFSIQPLSSFSTTTQNIVGVLSLLFFVTVSIWIWKTSAPGEFHWIKYKNTLVCFFLAVAAFPVSAFLLVGYQYAADLQQVLIQQRYTQLFSLLGMVDENYCVAEKQLGKLYGRLIHHPAFLQCNTTKIRRITETMLKNNLANAVYLCDKNGDMIAPREKRKNDAVGRIIPTIIRKLFARRNPATSTGVKNLISDAVVDSLADGVAEVILGTAPKKGLDFLIDKIGLLQEIKLGNRSQYFFMEFIAGNGDSNPSVLVFLQPKRDLSRFYMNWIYRNNHRPGKKWDFMKIGAIENFGDRQIRPKEFSKYPFLRELFNKVIATQANQQGRFEISGEYFLAVAAPMRQLNDYVLFAMYPEQLITDRIRGTQWRIAGIALLSIFVAYGAAILITRRSNAVSAIARGSAQ
ncbi:MAG: hypothetical protein HQM09_20210 [Candidatus Riflebacteria bacterium]|nr:hypothetical protein [Candidatus Riflebacteria bacterium]